MVGRILVGILALGLVAPSADAALRKYKLRLTNITLSPDVSPFPDNAPAGPQPRAKVLIDDTTSPGNPILKKLLYQANTTSTTLVPGLGNFIFTSNNFLEGPGLSPTQKTASPFTGTGSTAAGSTVAWGIVTGWTITGGFFCNSVPPIICEFAAAKDETTFDPIFTSDFFDLGTWSFHSTGFTATPFVFQYFTQSFGNRFFQYRGFRVIDALVPAVPLVGVVLLGGSLAVGAAVALRRREK